MRAQSLSRVHLITATALIAFGATGRLLLQDIPNIETITVVSLLAGSLLGGVWTVGVGLITIAITDAIIGNTGIAVYTWSAWAAMGLFGYVLRNRGKRAVRHALELTGMGVFGTVFFYVWTNFGVWHVGGLYPHTVDGLIASYVAGLPFLKYQLISTVALVPSVSVVLLWAWNRFAVKQTVLESVSVTPAYVRTESK